LTQQELAEKLGYKTNSYISDVESSHFTPSREKLKKLAPVFSVKIVECRDPREASEGLRSALSDGDFPPRELNQFLEQIMY
jgi:transcriptional regulator with XRE-family HTH domain